MEKKAVADLITEDNTLPNGMLAAVMRSSMENKNLLSKKGMIYVGTGETLTIIYGEGAGQTTYQVAKTAALEPPIAGQILVADPTAPLGIKWADAPVGAMQTFGVQMPSTPSVRKYSFTALEWSDGGVYPGKPYQLLVNVTKIFQVSSSDFIVQVRGMKEGNFLDSLMNDCTFNVTSIDGDVVLTLYAEQPFYGTAYILL